MQEFGYDTMPPEEQAAFDHYWYARNENPYEGGTQAAADYEEAFSELKERGPDSA